jgi:very-short-patch-repair endonuclease
MAKLKYNKEFFNKEFLPKIEQGWSAEQMGNYLGVKSKGVSMWVCAKKYATPDQLQKLTENGKKNKIKKIMYKEEYFCNNIKPLIELGWSVTKIFKHLKINEKTVRVGAERYGGDYYVQKLAESGKKAQQAVQNNAYNIMNSGRVKFIKEQDEKHLPVILELIEKGYDVYKIEKQINLWHKTVCRVIQRNCDYSVLKKLKQNLEINRDANNKAKGKKISKTRLSIFNAIFDKIVPLIEQGLTAKQIGDLFNRDQGAVHNLVKRCGSKELFKKLKENNARRKKEVAIQNRLKLAESYVSKSEKILHEVVLKYYPTAIPGLPVKRQDGFHWFIDIAIPELKLAVEFDGSFWHKEERDKRRDESLLSLGWKTLRLRYDYNPTFEELEHHFLTEVKQFIS